MHAFRLSIALAVASCAFAPSAKADLTVCNSTPDQVTVASAWVSPSGGFTSEGWWKLRACGGCERVVLRSETSDPHNYFFYAHGGGREWRGDSNFCTTQGAFKIGNAKRCVFGRRGQMKNFVHVTSRSGNHTHSLTGRSNSGRVCID